jgi:predicted ribosome quality control (RQC) complex YloA/Tae2 family protein
VLKKIESITQFDNERSFSLDFADNVSIIFKMHGQFANILLTENGVVTEIFRNHLQSDFEIVPEKLHRSIDFSRENFEKHQTELNKIYFTLGKRVWDFLDQNNFSQLGKEEQWNLWQATLQMLEQPTYYIVDDHGIKLSLLSIKGVITQYSDPVEAANEFAGRLMRTGQLEVEKQSTLQQLCRRLKSAEKYVINSREKLNSLLNDNHYQLWGDLIMANLHAIKAGMEKISLPNFYDQSIIDIKLKKELNAQKNAEIFYRKSKNQQIETRNLKEGIAKKEREVESLIQLIRRIETATDTKQVRDVAIEAGLDKKDRSETVRLPYHEFEFNGFRILVGRNAVDNDELTLKYSYKEDLWLHAKDVAGSHVLIKYQSGKKFPKDVIEYAAGLAAFNSKRKGESLCPVTVTPKKFVRKRKGDPPGAVVVEREEVILVPPVIVKS